MDYIEVPFVEMEHPEENIIKLSALLSTYDKNILGHQLWAVTSVNIKAFFIIAHNNQSIFIKYFIKEKYIRAFETETNGKVWEDSCVEFFISFDETAYYNIEFNCIGTGLIGYGSSRNDRKLLSAEIVKQIKTLSSIRSTDNDNKYWELTLVMPKEIFIHHDIKSFNGVRGSANFYKCGDKTPQPHYMAWSAIVSDEPDFHQPQFFGEIRFL